MANLDGMTQEDYNSFLDQFSKEFQDANGGINSIAQRATTKAGRDELNAALKQFNEDKAKNNQSEGQPRQPEGQSQQSEGQPRQPEGQPRQPEGQPRQQPQQPEGQSQQPEGQAQPTPQISEQEQAQQKLKEDFKKLYGDEYALENIAELKEKERTGQYGKKVFTLEDAKKILTAEDAGKTLKGYSTEDLAKIQFAVRLAEFNNKYGTERDESVAARDKSIAENKDKLNDAILSQIEDYSTGTKKVTGKDFKSYKLNKDSVNMLLENAPEELKKHCRKTLDKANRKVNPKGDFSTEQIARATTQKLKYKSMEIKDTDGLWTMAKKAVKMKGFTASRSAKKKIRKWWRTSKTAKFLKGSNRFTRAVHRGAVKLGNRVSLFPSRAKKAIGKFWTNKISGPIKRAWKEKVVDPFNNKIVQPTKKFVNEKVIQPVTKGYNASVEWIRDHTKTVLAVTTMAAAAGIGMAVAGPAGAVLGAKAGAALVGGAAAVYGTVKGVQAGYRGVVSAKNWAVDKTKESLKKSFEKNKAKVPLTKEQLDRSNRGEELTPEKIKELEKEEIAYTTGRRIYNDNHEEMEKVLGDYKKAISPEGNDGKPLTEKEAAIKLYQTMTASKDKNGLGLSQESAQAVMVYLHGKSIQSKFEDIKDEINKPVGKDGERTGQGQSGQGQEGQGQGGQGQAKPKREKVSEDVLLKRLMAIDGKPIEKDGDGLASQYLKAKREYLTTQYSKGDLSDKTKNKLGGLKSILGKIAKEDPELAEGFKEILGKNNKIKEFAKDKSKESKKRTQENDTRINPRGNGGAEMG